MGTTDGKIDKNELLIYSDTVQEIEICHFYE